MKLDNKTSLFCAYMDGVQLTTQRDPRLRQAARRGAFTKWIGVAILVMATAGLWVR